MSLDFIKYEGLSINMDSVMGNFFVLLPLFVQESNYKKGFKE
jgi:hypothetical protein